MLIAVITYMILGFVWDLWHPGWLVFVGAGIGSQIIRIIYTDE